MPRIKKFAPKLTTNLTNIQTFLLDTVYESEYFKITDFKDTLTGGKNGFLIEGSEYLKESTEIKIEILDAAGNPIYYEVAKGNPQYYETTSILVAVYIYNTTPVGPAKIVILGEAKTYNDNGVIRNVPDDWQGVYNVKWERSFKINRNLPNTDRVRFKYRPEIAVTELSGSTYIAQIEEIIQYGTVSGYPSTPEVGTVLPNKYYGDILYNLVKSGSGTTLTPQNEFWVDIPNELIKKKKTNNYRYYQLFKCDGNDIIYDGNYYLLSSESDRLVALYGLAIGGIRLFDDSNATYYILSGPVESIVIGGITIGPVTEVVDAFNNPLAQCSGTGTLQNVQALLGNLEEEPYVPFTSSILITNDGSKFPGQSILAPKITIPSASIYNEEVFQFLSDTELLIKTPYTIDGKIAEFNLFDYTMSYNSITNFTESIELTSYAQFTINNLNTYVGDVSRVKVFYKPTRTITDYELIDDLKIESVELFRDLFSGSYIEYGNFTGSINPFWITSSNANYTSDVTGEKVFSGVVVEAIVPTTSPFILQTSQSFSLRRDEEYTLYSNIQYTGEITNDTYFKAYISGSSYYSGSIQDITILNPIKQNKNQQRLSENIIVRESGEYHLIIEMVGDRWDFGGLSLKSAQDTSFSPDYFEFNLPVSRTKPVEYFDFKFEFYDINNNYIPTDLFANRIEFKEGSGSVFVTYDEVLDALSDLQDDIDNLTTDVLSKPVYKYGEILFGTGTTIISQSANLYWDIPNERLGINRKDPQYDVDISGSVRITENLIVSGSTQFGDNSVDNHIFTGSIELLGDESIDGLLYVNEFPIYQESLHDAFTGLINGGIITIDGSNGQVYRISSGSGYIINNYTDSVNPTYQYITWPNLAITASAFPGTGLNATTPRTNIAINTSGTVYEKTDKFSSQDYRQYIVLGRIVHINNNVITRTLSLPLTTYNRGFHWFDLANSIGPVNVVGNIYSAGGTDLTIQKSAGQTYRVGTNYKNNTAFPDITTDDISNPTSFRYRYRSGSAFVEVPLTTHITGSLYDDDSGTLQIVNNNQWTVQRIFFFGATATTIIQFAQFLYNSKTDAELAVFSELFETDPNLTDDALLRGYLLIRGGAINLSDLDDAVFLEAVGAGAGGGGGGGGATTLESLTDVSYPTTLIPGQTIVYTGSDWVNGYPSTASFASTASYVNPLVQNVIITGSLDISGSISINAGDLIINGTSYNAATSGTSGTSGSSGSSGTSGSSGSSGTSGSSGSSGTSGSSGSSGTSGSSGSRGTSGSSGSSGTSGSSGSSGTSGSSGSSGTSGSSGSSGTSGSSGSSGTSGSSGSSGTSGSSGSSGTSGSSGSSGLLLLTGNTNNGIITLNGTAPSASVESNLTFDGDTLSVTGSVNISGNITASLQEGYVWVGDENGVNIQVPTSSLFDQNNYVRVLTIPPTHIDFLQPIKPQIVNYINNIGTYDTLTHGHLIIEETDSKWNIVIYYTPSNELSSTTEINIWFDNSGSMTSTLAPLINMVASCLKELLLPIYGDETTYNQRVKIRTFSGYGGVPIPYQAYIESGTIGTERFIRALNVTGSVEEITQVINLVFQDEAQGEYYSGSFNPTTSPLNSQYNTNYVPDITQLRNTLNDITNTSYYKGVVYQINETIGSNFKGLLEAISGSTYPSYSGNFGLEDKIDDGLMRFQYDIEAAGSSNYYLSLIRDTLISFGYENVGNIPSIPCAELLYGQISSSCDDTSGSSGSIDVINVSGGSGAGYYFTVNGIGSYSIGAGNGINDVDNGTYTIVLWDNDANSAQLGTTTLSCTPPSNYIINVYDCTTCTQIATGRITPFAPLGSLIGSYFKVTDGVTNYAGLVTGGTSLSPANYTVVSQTPYVDCNTACIS